MKTTTAENSTAETGCCPRFNPEDWDQKEFVWQNRLFVKDRVRAFFHMPLNFGGVMTRNMNLIEKAQVHTDKLTLSEEDSLWGSNLYISVDKDVPGARMQHLSGTFVCRSFEGPFSQMGRWIREMKGYLKDRGIVSDKLWFYYTTCPKCAKVYGKNYVVILAQR